MRSKLGWTILASVRPLVVVSTQGFRTSRFPSSKFMYESPMLLFGVCAEVLDIKFSSSPT